MTRTSITSVIIAGNQFLITEGLRSLLSADNRFTVAAIAGNREEMYRALNDHDCAVLIVDTAMPGLDGSKDVPAIREKVRGVVLVSDIMSKTEFSEFSRNGVKSVLYKTADREEILSAVDAALKNKKFYSGEILDMLTESAEQKLSAEEPTHLTASEMEIVRLIASGLTTKEIARRKNISFHTVNTHRKNIFRKTDVSNASELVMYAIRAGWIDNIEYYI